MALEIFYDAERDIYVVVHDKLDWGISKKDPYAPMNEILRHFNDGHPRNRLGFVARTIEDLKVFGELSDVVDKFFDIKEDAIPGRMRKK